MNLKAIGIIISFYLLTVFAFTYYGFDLVYSIIGGIVILLFLCWCVYLDIKENPFIKWDENK